jgi:hypothetical protein
LPPMRPVRVDSNRRWFSAEARSVCGPIHRQRRPRPIASTRPYFFRRRSVFVWCCDRRP